MNKIGLHIGYWWGTSAAFDIFKMLELTHRAKLDAIEINPAWLLKMSDIQCREFLQRAKEYGMVITLNGGLDQQTMLHLILRKPEKPVLNIMLMY